jgi:citrate lyase beta subunit
MPPAPPRITALLFTPGSRPERFAKAAASGADGIIVDLEDAIGAGDKDRVRGEVMAWLQKNGKIGTPPFLTGLRLNSLRTPAGRADLDALRAANLKPDFVMLPKVESAAEVQLAAAKLPMTVRLICLTETVRGVRFADEIAAASPRVIALAFGGIDLSAETGGEPVWDALLWPRTQVVHACAAAGVVALDQPFVDHGDAAGLEAECLRVRPLGYSGKLAIHPSQCATIARAFQPTPPQLERARRIVAAYEEAKGNVASLDGQMIDVPIYRSARRVLERAGAGSP